jgi:hypothetical protein
MINRATENRDGEIRGTARCPECKQLFRLRQTSTIMWEGLCGSCGTHWQLSTGSGVVPDSLPRADVPLDDSSTEGVGRLDQTDRALDDLDD